MFPAVMHRDGVTHHLREYCGRAGPCFDDRLLPALIHRIDAPKQAFFNKRSFFN
jgi:hypothetical protein